MPGAARGAGPIAPPLTSLLVLVISGVRIFDEAGAGVLDSAGIVGFLMITAWVLAASLLLLLRPGDCPNDSSV